MTSRSLWRVSTVYKSSRESSQQGLVSTTWRSPARRVLVVLEVAFAESRPSTFSVDAVGVRGVDVCSPFRLSDPFGYPAGSLETGSFYPQYRSGSGKPHPCSLSGHAISGAAPFPGMPALVGR